MSIVSALSAAVGVDEAALRILLSIFLCYPIAYVYRQRIHNEFPKLFCQLFLTAAGIAIGLFNYGILVYHSMIAVVATFLFIQFLPAETLLVPVSFTFHLGYLIIGYFATTTENYDITWTMPHCVLTLRLIGLAFDVADATIPVEKQSRDQKRFCIKDKPDLLEIATYTFFPASYLVGPQYQIERLRRYLNHEFDQYTQYTTVAIERLRLGVVMLVVNQILAIFVNDSTLLDDGFADRGFLTKLFLMAMWAKINYWRYSACWIIAEGSLVLGGFTFVGLKANGDEDWSALVNSKPLRFEQSRKFQHYVESFNIQTNNWVAHYVYKRLKWMNNKIASFVGTLFFLAIWHGFHSGYFMTFAMEFFTVTVEKEVDAAIERNDTLDKFFKTTPGKALMYITCYTYVFVIGGWNLVPFVLLSFSKWWSVFAAVHYIGLIFAPLAFASGPILRALFPRTKEGKLSNGPATPGTSKKAE